MKPEDLITLQSGQFGEIKAILEEFNKKYTDLFDFTEFNINGQWTIIWNTLFSLLKENKNAKNFPEILSTIRILTRDKNNINLLNIQNDLDCLLKIADLGSNIEINSSSITPYSTETIIEALKCLCNLIYQSTEGQKLCAKNSSIEGILRRLKCEKNYPYEIELYDMKLLFLITAFEVQACSKFRDHLNGLTYLTEWLDIKFKENPDNVELICEVLKIIFNITANNDKNSNESEILNCRLINVLKTLLSKYGCNDGDAEINAKYHAAISHTINVLTNIPVACFSELITQEDKSNLPNKTIFEGHCVRILEIILEFLKLSLDRDHEKLPPILIVLIKSARCNPVMRHYIKSVLLPPLKDVSHRPEVGNELRNHLCRFLTTVDLTLRDLSAELLFICCKENAARMIKYTGYGNAAGLFAAKGILDCRKKEHAEYSSDSEDSDTEEYKQALHGVNPVLGCYESQKPDPYEGMSDEQKEFEAMELVKLMDKLHKQGIVQPCRIDDDGKPQPVDHILQLQEELPQQQIEKKSKT